MGGSERGLDDGVVSCSRTPHDKAVVGGRAQVKLPRHLVLGMRVELKKMKSRATRARELYPFHPATNWVRSGSTLLEVNRSLVRYNGF